LPNIIDYFVRSWKIGGPLGVGAFIAALYVLLPEWPEPCPPQPCAPSAKILFVRLGAPDGDPETLRFLIGAVWLGASFAAAFLACAAVALYYWLFKPPGTSPVDLDA
jgi:hypothetical protein